MLEWIRFITVALLFAAGIISLYISVFGTFRFSFALNRIHSAAIVDTLVLVLFILGCIIASGFNVVSLKLLLIVTIQWFTSPLVSHMLLKSEYLTYEHLDDHCEIIDEEDN